MALGTSSSAPESCPTPLFPKSTLQSACSPKPVFHCVSLHAISTNFLCSYLSWPGTVNLGIGFYGRSFTLANPSCNTAGCPMKGGGTPGPCTGKRSTPLANLFNLMRVLCRWIRVPIIWGDWSPDSNKEPQSSVQQNFADHGTYLWRSMDRVCLLLTNSKTLISLLLVTKTPTQLQTNWSMW